MKLFRILFVLLFISYPESSTAFDEGCDGLCGEAVNDGGNPWVTSSSKRTLKCPNSILGPYCLGYLAAEDGSGWLTLSLSADIATATICGAACYSEINIPL